MTNTEYFFEEQELRLRQTSETGDQDGTYEELNEDPAVTSQTQTVFAKKTPIASKENVIFIN